MRHDPGSTSDAVKTAVGAVAYLLAIALFALLCAGVWGCAIGTARVAPLTTGGTGGELRAQGWALGHTKIEACRSDVVALQDTETLQCLPAPGAIETCARVKGGALSMNFSEAFGVLLGALGGLVPFFL